jgi:hypothetical protein
MPTAFSSRSRTRRPKSSQRCDTSSTPLRQRQTLFAACSRNLGKRRRRNGRFRRDLPAFLLKSIVDSKKTNHTINKLFLILGAPLRHVDDAPRHHLAHSTGIGWPGALASRLKEPVPKCPLSSALRMYIAEYFRNSAPRYGFSDPTAGSLFGLSGQPSR